MRLLVLSFLVMTSIRQLQAQESAQYLQNAIRDLRYMKGRQTLKRVDTAVVQAIIPEDEPTISPAPTQVAERRIQNNKSVPPLSLTKGELAALYEAAVAKGETVKLNTGDDSYIHAAVHELDSQDSPSYNHEDNIASPSDSNPATSGDASGYYYYYYPVKSFLDEMTSQSSSHEYHYSSPSHRDTKSKRTTTEKPQFQYHSHTHQHNVKITSTKEMVPEKKDKKALEPLFMAISGFIGMAVMFVLSVLVFPKFGIKKTKGGVKKSERITDIARVALQAIEGKDCAERFACELEKTARAFHLQDNRFMKLLKRMAPGTFGKEMDRVGKYSNKKLRCTAIPCKKKNPPKKKPNAGAQKKA